MMQVVQYSSSCVFVRCMYSVIQGTKLCSLEALTYEDKPIRSLKWSLYVLFKFNYKVSYYSTYCILCVYRRLCLCMYAYKKACTPIPPNSIYHYCSLHCTVSIKLNSMCVRVTHKYTYTRISEPASAGSI